MHLSSVHPFVLQAAPDPAHPDVSMDAAKPECCFVSLIASAAFDPARAHATIAAHVPAALARFGALQHLSRILPAVRPGGERLAHLLAC